MDTGVRSQIQIKGMGDGVLIVLGDGEWGSLRQQLFEQLDQQAEFFRGARLALDVGGMSLKAAELGDLRSQVSERGMVLGFVLSRSAVTEQNAKSLGLDTSLGRGRPEPDDPEVDTTLRTGEAAILVSHTLRSGFSVQYAGHVTILGDVNPGAEVVAAGNVLVWGRLRGMVHAGAEGDESAVVCALDLSPTQLRIAGRIAVTPGRKNKPLPEKAYLHNGQVVAEPWNPKSK
jgi:septum site-determining protein MinC